VSHATPGAWLAHNNDRNNGYAIADEGFFGDPNTTGTISNPGYGGGHGPTEPPADVIIGDRRNGFINSLITDKLSAESGTPGRHYLVERTSGVDGGNALFTAAGSSGVTKLAGLFDHFYHNADGLGGTAADRLENPALPESTLAALTVLNKDPHGFVLMIEGGAIDWAGHANNMDHLIGEMQKFNDTVQAVIDWINNPGNGSSWNNALLIVTSDHECGYLTKDFGLLPDVPLGAVTDATISIEQIVKDTGGRRASWTDQNLDGYINNGETVHWTWNSGDHTNSLAPLFARGAGSELFGNHPVPRKVPYQSFPGRR
jgi:alkaline phosphatase